MTNSETKARIKLACDAIRSAIRGDGGNAVERVAKAVIAAIDSYDSKRR